MDLALGTAEGLAELAPLSDALLKASQPYVGQWQRLVSTTNWEKGRIIQDWRQSLIAQGAPVTDYSDEAWGRLVGGVTGQHVGRLRRVFQRFGESYSHYAGLYWSHFQAALDWDDAEMWLEGAVRSGWSISEMRETRWKTLGQVEADRPRQEDVVANETDEDFEPARRTEPEALTGEYGEVTGPRHEEPDFGDGEGSSNFSRAAPPDFEAPAGAPVELVRPFENLPDLPDDLAEAFDAMKLAILRHKTNEWREISASDTLRAIQALSALVTAPADEAPF